MYTEIDQLLKGFRDEEGVLHTEIEYREMTGEDEEAIAKPKVKDNSAIVTRVLLERCLVRIGTIEKAKLKKPTEWTNVIQSLTVGDQDYAIMKIREASLGSDLEVAHQCPQCKTKIESVFSMDELPLVPYNGLEEIEFELPKGFRDKEGNVHKEGIMRYATGLDREILNKLVTQNPSVANTLLLTRCIKSLGEIKVTDDTFRKLSLMDRNYLFKLISENSFGYDVKNFEIECPNCGKNLSVSFNQTDFL